MRGQRPSKNQGGDEVLSAGQTGADRRANSIPCQTEIQSKSAPRGKPYRPLPDKSLNIE
jgi:hypothetical protein